MRNLGISVEQVRDAIESFASNKGGGFIDVNNREFLIRHKGRTLELDDLRQLAVAWQQSTSVRLDQVANVRYAVAVKRGDGGYNGKPAVIINVQKQPGADTVELQYSINCKRSTRKDGTGDDDIYGNRLCAHPFINGRGFARKRDIASSSSGYFFGLVKFNLIGYLAYPFAL